MPLLMAAGISAGGAIIGGGLGAWGANKASKDSLGFLNGALQYAQNAELPFVNAGHQAVNAMTGLEGIGGQRPDYSAFMNSPDFTAATQLGTEQMMKAQSAQGNWASGSGMQAYGNYLTQLASQNYGNYYARLAGLASLGSNAASSSSNLVASLGSSMANAKAGGVLGMTNAGTGAISGVGNAFNQYAQNNMLQNMWAQRYGNGSNNNPTVIGGAYYNQTPTAGWNDLKMTG